MRVFKEPYEEPYEKGSQEWAAVYGVLHDHSDAYPMRASLMRMPRVQNIGGNVHTWHLRRA